MPVAAEIDKTEQMPVSTLREMAELGLMGMIIPEEHGGSEAGGVAYAIAMAEIAEACASNAVTMGVTNMVAEAIVREGTPEQIARWVPPLVDGTYAAGIFALSEPHSGSDAAALSTTAVRDGSGDDADYILSGSKVFITSAKHGGVAIVMARTSKESKAGGVSAFLVEPSAPGYILGRKEDKMGQRGSETYLVTLEDCRVPASQRLAPEGHGFKVAMRSLDSGRIAVGAQAVGTARAAMAASARYAQERKQFGQAIARFQAIQWKLADMATELEAAWHLVLRAAWLKDRSTDPSNPLPGGFSRESAMAKLFATEAAFRACEEAVQIHGGYGYTREFPVERYLRDVRVTRIYEGASEVQRIVIARNVLAGLAG